MINFNKSITRTDLDMKAYNAKFKMADDWLENKKGGDKLIGSMLLDPTLFCYLNFKLDNKPLKMYPFQDLILQDKWRYLYLEASNQIGKSITFVAKGSTNLLIDHGHSHNEGIISASLDLAKFQMRRVKSLLNSMKTID